MRILIVSAHFPPNFVSGGTLVPFRSALELSRRGHEVRVFAGWIGPARPPGDAFDDVVEESFDDVVDGIGGSVVGVDGVGGSGHEERVPRGAVRVRWFTTNDAIDWASRLNFDNPAATAEFAATLRAFRPDVVHFHSMQGLGAGLLSEAARLGVVPVVTAHDFWWWCGRQFLCDRDYHPCSPVVVAGVCQCAVDRDWLEERTRFTTAALALAARVVAVSESSATVLRANGVPPEQLVVVDNPVEGVGPGPPRLSEAQPATHPEGARRSGIGRAVRFVFAGGSDPMKGLPVLREALGMLGSRSDVTGWRADLYGVGEQTREAGDGLGESVRTHPAFNPDDLALVLSGADVLVVPSVMQETYSILTREALASGVPVVTTTCLGPEEVVTDGVNGIVVPQDDPGALAAAMARLVVDPSLLTKLKGAVRGVALTTVRAHCDQLEALYAACLQERSGGDGNEPTAGHVVRRRVGRVLFVVGIDGAPLRYRAHLPAEALELHGVHADVRHYRHPDIVDLAESADVVVLYRVPATRQIQGFVESLRRRETPVLFDVDDLIFDPDLEPEIPALRILRGADRDLWIQGVHRYRTTMEMCDAFVGSTEVLCDHATAVTGLPSFRFRNGAGIGMGRLADVAVRHGRTPGPVRVGYLSGTDTHDHDWAMVEEAVVTALESVPGSELWLVGKLTPGREVRRLGDRLRLVPFQPWTALPELLRTIDVNLAPLVPESRFNDAKSAIKWLEAALSGTPTIATPTQPFREVVDDGVNGLLAEGDEQWAKAVSSLVGDDVLRRRLGSRARRDALLGLGPWTQGQRYLDILESVERRPSYASAWRPVALDEPFEPIALEPYGGRDAGTGAAAGTGTGAATAAMSGAYLRALARRGASSVRRRGVLETARLALSRIPHKVAGRGRAKGRPLR